MWRQILYKTHLWLGIVSGIVLFIVCLSGMLLVFRWEIIQIFEHDKYSSVSTSEILPLNIDELVAKVEQHTNGKISIIYTENRSNGMKNYIMCIKTENNKNLKTEHQFCSIDPYTGEISDKNFSLLAIFFYIITKLHTSLFLPNPIGRMVVGSATLIFIIVALSGLGLWFPANFHNTKAWKNSFLVRFRKGKHSLIFNLHKTLGFYVLIPMLLMALTGLMWSFQWYCNSVAMILNVPTPHSYNKVKSSPQNPDAQRLALDFFDKKADELFAPHKEVNRNIYLPEHENDPVMMMGWHQGIWNSTWGLDRIQFDQYTGEVLQFDQFDKFSIGRKIVTMFPFIHYGSFFGLPTKIIYFLACLITTTLPITGVSIWWRKLRNLRKAQTHKITENQQKSA
ncbi:MAG: PepSY domain-containing protein [Planctomycetaceae bacterium]|nr:PepSY domain-containing protein [Planctomycetaceae bacterium]